MPKPVLTTDETLRLHRLPPPAVLPNGTFKIRQRSTGRYLDAPETSGEDVRLVTRPPQDGDTQRWQLTKVGTVFVVQQRSTGRCLDANDTDFRVVTQDATNSPAQRWIAMADGDGACTLRQLSTRRFIDTHETAAQGCALVTRPGRNDDTKKWVIRRVGPHTFTIRQRSSGRFVGAHELASEDFSAVTRADHDDDGQRWIFSPAGAVYALVQSGTFQLLDSDDADTSGALVTRPPRSHDAQRWILMPAACGSFTIQQLSTGGFVDSRGSAADGYRVVARGAEPGETQRWMFDRVV